MKSLPNSTIKPLINSPRKFSETPNSPVKPSNSNQLGSPKALPTYIFSGSQQSASSTGNNIFKNCHLVNPTQEVQKENAAKPNERKEISSLVNHWERLSSSSLENANSEIGNKRLRFNSKCLNDNLESISEMEIDCIEKAHLNENEYESDNHENAYESENDENSEEESYENESSQQDDENESSQQADENESSQQESDENDSQIESDENIIQGKNYPNNINPRENDQATTSCSETDNVENEQDNISKTNEIPKVLKNRKLNEFSSRASFNKSPHKEIPSWQHEDVFIENNQRSNVKETIPDSYIKMPSAQGQNSTNKAPNNYECSSSVAKYENEKEQLPSYSLLTNKVQANNNEMPNAPLAYTVSFYRKQKQENRNTPVQTIIRREQIASTPSPSHFDQKEIIEERIKALQDEIKLQQTVISQSSQALNLCHAASEFTGSTEQVEAERLLLIATQKRQAYLNEIQRLKTHGAQGENVKEGTGSLIINNIQLPLKREFIASQLEGKGGDVIHYFICLLRYGPQVVVTHMVSSDDKSTDGALCFTNHILLQNLPADFSVVFEVYAFKTKKEMLPHEKKYHIKRDSGKIRLTPKNKRGDGKILLPAVSSPGGPNAVRTSSFEVVGYTRFNIQNCNKTSFILDKIAFSSPLEGVLKVKLQLHAEVKIAEKGFLTMFEDVSGFGAWHRRWCALDAQCLSYWKYPDDEKSKEPIGLIDLKQCITNQVGLVSRDICARPHTFQLVTVRPQEKGDKNTLITKSVNTLTTTKHLLSADTKEERIQWCNKLNEALINVRKWNPDALGSFELKHDK